MEGNDRPIIVVGCARSGTTLLQSMIHAHPRLAMPPENRFMMKLYSERTNYGDLRTPEGVEKLADALCEKGTKLKDLGLTRADVRARLHETPATLGSMVGSVLQSYAELHGRARWGDKRPNYIQFVDRVMALFPDAQLVHIIRDGRDSAASLLTMPWWDHGYMAAVAKWKDAIIAGNQARADYGSDSYYEFRYEDLTADPETALRGLCEYLGEDFHEAMLEPHRISDLTPDYKVWHEGLDKPVNQTAVKRWQQDLTEEQVALFEWVAADQLQQHGYEITLDGMKPMADILARWDRAEQSQHERERKRLKAEANRLHKDAHPIAAILTTGQRALAAEQGWLADYDVLPGRPATPAAEVVAG